MNHVKTSSAKKKKKKKKKKTFTLKKKMSHEQLLISFEHQRNQIFTELHETQSSVVSAFKRADKRAERLEGALRAARNRLAKSLVETRAASKKKKGRVDSGLANTAAFVDNRVFFLFVFFLFLVRIVYGGRARRRVVGGACDTHRVKIYFKKKSGEIEKKKTVETTSTSIDFFKKKKKKNFLLVLPDQKWKKNTLCTI
jgi:hypothetical protein